MSHLALARKWRPQKFEDVIGQRGVVETLRNAIGSGRIAQSYIFAGPRGVGKTTTARILARALNCVKGPTADPCGECDACIEIAEGRDIDVLEIDGATYTGVDDVREVIVEPLSIAPMRDRFKIFIIDEVHRLSKHAFDALLKSIEEPPPYVRFMMATTELHAVPATIQSRSQLFELKSLPFTSIREQLKDVADREGVVVDDAALALLARAAEGSMRDALSALDQVLAFTADRVTAAEVSAVLGVIGRDLQFEIAETVAGEDVAGAFDLAGRVVEAGFDLRIVCREMARLVRDLMVVQIDPARLQDAEIAADSERDRLGALAGQYSREDLLRAFDLLAKSEFEIRHSSQPRHHFEMMLVKWIHLRQLTPLTEIIAVLEGGSRPAGSGRPDLKVRPSGRRADSGSNDGPKAAPAEPEGSALRGTRAAVPARGPKTESPGGPNLQVRPGRAKPSGSDRPVRPSDRLAGSGPDEGPKAPAEPEGSARRGTRDAAPARETFLASIREQNKVFHGMVVAQAQRIDVEGDTVVFTFAPVHRALRGRFEEKRAWLRELATKAMGRPMGVEAREAAPREETGKDADGAGEAQAERRASLEARARAEPAVQAVLDVLGGEIEDVEEIR